VEPAPDPQAARVSGRDREVEQLTALMGRSRTVTVRGLAGVGKTHFVRAALPEAMFVRCAHATSELDLVAAVAHTAGIPMEDDPTGSLAPAIANRRVVVLDAVPDIDALPVLLSAWRRSAPDTRFVLTSRRALRFDGEEVLSLGPLSAIAAADLLSERAGVAIRDEPAIGALLEWIDGMPLTLELAAVQLRVRSLADLIGRLDASSVAERMKVAIAWAWEAASDRGRDAWAALATLDDPVDPSTAESLASSESLSELVGGGVARRDDESFSLPEPLRVFVRSADPPRWAAAHSAEFVRAATGAPEVPIARRLAALRRAERCDDADAVVAIATAAAESLRVRGPGAVLDAVIRVGLPFARRSSMERAVRLMDIAAGRLKRRGQTDEARRLWGEMLSTTSPAARARAGVGLASLAWHEGDYDEADRLLVGAASDVNRADTPDVRSDWHCTTGMVLVSRGRWQEAIAAYELALEVNSDPRRAGSCHGNIGQILMAAGRIALAEQRFGRAAEAFGQVRDAWSLAQVQCSLGALKLDAGDLDGAVGCLRRAQEQFEDLGDAMYRAWVLELRADVASHLGEVDEADRRFAEAIAAHERTGRRPGGASATARHALHCWAYGREAEALSLFEAARHDAAAVDSARVLQYVDLCGGAFLADIGEVARAKERIARGHASATAARQPVAIGVARLADAFLALAMSADPRPAREALAAVHRSHGEEVALVRRSAAVRRLAWLLHRRLDRSSSGG
ncbi:MAG: hypothetical protein ABMB14_09790, partial [Myxococcota bacterium]